VERRTKYYLQMPNTINTERRACTRFPMKLKVDYTVSDRRRALVKTGSGHTIDLSSCGLSFTTDSPLITGLSLKMSIDWPVLLDGAVKLQLVLSGAVVRANGAVAALRIRRHQFRTSRFGLNPVPREKSAG
jgi:hypothetical protein